MRIRVQLFGLCLLLASGPALASGIRQLVVHPGWTAQRWGVEDGLPVNSINALLQDGKGFLWLATMDGLVRFDGLRFEVFNSLNSPGLAGNRLLVLKRDGDGALWMATEDMRLVRYHEGAFRTLGREDGLPHESVIALSVRDTAVWVGTSRGAARWTGARFEALPAPVWSEATTAVLDAGAAGVWLGAESGRLLHLDPDGGHATTEAGGRIWQLEGDGEGGVWIAHHAGLARSTGGGALVELMPGSAVQRIVRLGPSLYLAGTERILRRVNGNPSELGGWSLGSGRERLAAHGPGGIWLNTEDGLQLDDELILRPRLAINDWIVDSSGSLLVATAGDGLYRLGPNAFERPSGPLELREAATYPIVTAGDGAIWVGTLKNGVYAVLPGRKEAKRIAANSAPRVVYSVLPEHGENGWVAGEGLWRIDQGQAHQQGVPGPLKDASIRALYRDRLERIWVGTDDEGVWRLTEGRWQSIALPPGLGSGRVRVIVERGDSIFMGSNGNGLLRFRDGIGFETPAATLPGRLIRALHFDARGRLLIGTEDRGLCRMESPGAELRSAQVHCLDRRDGLPHDGIHQILADGEGRLWMSTNGGVFSVAAAALDAAFEGGRVVARLLTETEGMPDREANGGVQSAGTAAPDGRLWFPTVKGPVALDIGRLAQPPAPPIAVIEHLTTADGAKRFENAPVALDAGERSISLRYTAADLLAGGSVQFETRLIGLDRDWQDIGTRREVDYTNLSHGAYRFEVRARTGPNDFGPIASLDLEVPALLHETTAFRSLSALLLALLALIGWRWREQRQQRSRLRLEQEVAARTRELSEATAEAERARDQIARQAERLESLDQEKRSFFANISHELRTPLTLLLGPLEQGQQDPQAMIEQWPLMRRNARRLNRLVEQILDLQRIEGGSLRIEPERHDLVEWTRSVASLFQPLAQSRDIALLTSAPDDGAMAWFDAPQMEKVLGNLLSNAIKYCRPGDRVDVRVVREGETASVEVVDTGPGIEAEHLPRLFDRFYRAMPKGFPIEGTGIGLALARELMLLHGGDLTVRNAESGGACFTARWPARASACDAQQPDIEAPSEPAVIPAPAPAPSHNEWDPADRPRVLVVDDNADLREWLRHSLSGRYVVDVAASGRDALAALEAHLPDLVVTDWMMPDMDGIELLERMRRSEVFDGLPAIVLSARAEIGDRIRGLDSGAVAYLQKPFRIDLLLAQIESLLALRLRLRRAFEARPVASAPPAAASEGTWLSKLRDVIDAELHDPGFSVECLAERMAIGRTGLFRRLKDETGQSPSELLREARLLRAAGLLDQRAGSVSEIAYAVGFSSVDGFTRAFVARFRQRPSERLEQARQGSASIDGR
ncbi:Signal transduction histidine kinase [Aquimonas voraii]|uniref:histidine kinase n=1 Tax=Aquimonas voraii TaxID=265719 RepID=A0A1G6ZWL9_9GAMM|nr:Signal transduction histidine kinase [Aquimonas voraii]